MSAQGTYRFYSVQRQTILLVNGEPLGRERLKEKRNFIRFNHRVFLFYFGLDLPWVKEHSSLHERESADLLDRQQVPNSYSLTLLIYYYLTIS